MVIANYCGMCEAVLHQLTQKTNWFREITKAARINVIYA